MEINPEQAAQNALMFEGLAENLINLRVKVEIMVAALHLIAAPKRPDGTYNRCREACEQLAKETLEQVGCY